MKKIILFYVVLGATSQLVAQNTRTALNQKFEREKLENESKFDQFISKNNFSNLSDEEILTLKSRLAGFAGNQPIFLKEDDVKSNNSANVTALQNGTLTGLNGTQINGAGLNIIVMDGGRVFEKHVDFGASSTGIVTTHRIFDKENGQVGYSSHSTGVAGIIGSQGVSHADSKGVLTATQIDSYTFSTTTGGNLYQKLNNATGANISNHSYGINLGWAQQTNGNWHWVSDYDISTEDTYSNSYGSQDASYDNLVYSNPNHIIIKSTGNYYGDGPNGSSTNAYKYSSSSNSYVPFLSTDVIPANNCSLGYYCIGWGSLAKNIITVGATNQLTTSGNLYQNPTNVVKASFSSAGPRKDGAVKPDIAAVGVFVRIPRYVNGTTYNSSYLQSGTSFSAPEISGIAGALTHVKRSLSGNTSFTFKGDEMKALLIHTTNEAGNNPGPDVHFGWGFVDATKAAQVLIDNQVNTNTFTRPALVSGVPNNLLFTAQANTPLKATISWIDPAATPFTTSNDLQNNHSSRIINDLDLRIIDTVTNEIYYPWKLDLNNLITSLTPLTTAPAVKGDNTVDNVEQVLINNPVAGRTYRVEVGNKGILIDNNGVPTTQNYALIVTGYTTQSLGNHEINLQETISIYPTLVEDYVTIVSPSGAEQVSVLDMSGKLVFDFKNSKGTEQLDFQSLPTGTYIINIKTKEGTVSKKVIKK